MSRAVCTALGTCQRSRPIVSKCDDGSSNKCPGEWLQPCEQIVWCCVVINMAQRSGMWNHELSFHGIHTWTCSQMTKAAKPLDLEETQHHEQHHCDILVINPLQQKTKAVWAALATCHRSRSFVSKSDHESSNKYPGESLQTCEQKVGFCVLINMAQRSGIWNHELSFHGIHTWACSRMTAAAKPLDLEETQHHV